MERERRATYHLLRDLHGWVDLGAYLIGLITEREFGSQVTCGTHHRAESTSDEREAGVIKRGAEQSHHLRGVSPNRFPPKTHSAGGPMRRAPVVLSM